MDYDISYCIPNEPHEPIHREEILYIIQTKTWDWIAHYRTWHEGDNPHSVCGCGNKMDSPFVRDFFTHQRIKHNMTTDEIINRMNSFFWGRVIDY
jgi:hypothetical protein